MSHNPTRPCPSCGRTSDARAMRCRPCAIAAMYGRRLSTEARAKLAAANRGKSPSAETRAKIGATLRGRHPSPETRAKLSAAHLGKPRPDMVGNRRVLDASVKGDCAYCGKPATTRDHVLPLSRGGTDDPANVVVCCVSCNSSKANRTPEEWRAGTRARRMTRRAA